MMAAAETLRARKSRRLAREGWGCLTVEVNLVDLAELLHMAGYIDGNLADDRQALAEATSRYLNDMAEPPECNALQRALRESAIFQS